MSFINRVKAAWRVMTSTAVLVSDDGHFRTEASLACDVAYMVSCMEPLSMHKNVDKFELGELIWGYLDGQKSPDEVREEVIEWLRELDDGKKNTEARARAEARGFDDRFEMEQIEDDPEYWHLVDRGNDDDIIDVGNYRTMFDLMTDLRDGTITAEDAKTS